MRQQEAIELRPLLPADLPAAQRLTAGFGWPHRVDDWAMMHRLGRGLAAIQDGALVGAGMGWRFGQDWGSIGLIGVSPSMQGRGLGRRLTQALVEDLQGRSILLHATAAGLKLYRELGFYETGVIHQYQSAAFRAAPVALAAGDSLRPLRPGDAPSVAALDRAATGRDRGALLAELIGSAHGVVLEREGRPAGFAMLRPFGRGQVIGPVAAPDAKAAQAMVMHWLAANEGQFVRIDIPEESGLAAWLEELGLADAGPAIRMVRGEDARRGEGTRCFALVSQALG